MIEMPATWANLPFMALPDGAHDYDEDFVFFTIPRLDLAARSTTRGAVADEEALHGGQGGEFGPRRGNVLYCVACYRQISARVGSALGVVVVGRGRSRTWSFPHIRASPLPFKC